MRSTEIAEPVSQTQLLQKAVEYLGNLNGREVSQWTPPPDYTEVLERIAAKEVTFPEQVSPVVLVEPTPVVIPAPSYTSIVEALEKLVAKETPSTPPAIDLRPLLAEICHQLYKLNTKEIHINLPPPAPINLTVKQESSLEWLWSQIKEIFHAYRRN